MNHTAKTLFSTLALLVSVATPLLARDLGIAGHYLEARTSDVYTGPCFANSEVNLTGKEAILAWQVTEGGFSGSNLAGLNVVAVVRTDVTLGDPYADPSASARSVLVVDAAGSPAQREALVAFARSMAGALLGEVVAVEAVPIEFAVTGAGAASMRAGDLAALSTRPLNHHDHLCGNEEVYYPPLTGVQAADPAVTLEHFWSGQGLDSTWSSPGKRSAFVGSFAR